MRKRVILILLSIMFMVGCGCGASIKLGPIKASVRFKEVIIHDYNYSHLVFDSYVIASVNSDEWIKKQIVDHLADYEFATKEVKEVRIVVSIQNETKSIAGLYLWKEDIIYLALDSNNIIDVFTHELGHAVWDTMNETQQKEWIMLYIETLGDAGLEMPMYSKYRQATDDQDKWFVSRYCLHSPTEYFAENFMYYCMYRDHLKFYFPQEYKLLDKHIKELRNAYKDSKNKSKPDTESTEP